MPTGGMGAPRLMRLRYRGSCHLCDRDLPPGTQAWWDSAAHTATCVPCEVENPADPFAGVADDVQGLAGGSAQVEHDRRVAQPRHDRRSSESWKKGAEGERLVSAVLHKEAGTGQVTVLDDRRIPGSTANIDHIAIARPGVFVVDAKNYAGTVERRVDGSGRRRSEHLIVNGRDRTKLATAMQRQVDAVRAAVDHLVPRTLDARAETPVIPVLCFVGADNWGMFESAFTVGDVRVLSARALRKVIRRDGPLGGATRARLARLLSTQLSPASRLPERRDG